MKQIFIAFVLLVCGCVSATPAPRPALAFRYQGLDGSTKSIGQNRGKITLIQVFATWAQPALIEVPLLQALESRYGKDRLAIVQIALDPTPESIQVYADTFGVQNWVGIAADPDRFISADGPLGRINTIPSSFLLDRRGRILKKQEGLWDQENLKTTLSELLAADRSTH